MIRGLCVFVVLFVLVGCQQHSDSMESQIDSGPPTSVQKVQDSVEEIRELTLQVVYQNGEEVRVHYVQGEEEQWVFHNDLVKPSMIDVDELDDKMSQLTIDKGTFTEEVVQQMRHVFEFGGLYDVLDLEITFDDGTTRQYKPDISNR